MPTMQGPPGPVTVVDGRQYLYFAGTGYLGLQGRAEVIAASCEAAEQYGAGSATSRSRTGFGDTPPTLLVERRAAEFFGSETSLVIPSGFLGPHVLLDALRETYDVLFLDAHCHSAIPSAAVGMGKPIVRFQHANPADLLEKLCLHSLGGLRPLIATDGVFSASGSLAPLAEYCDILRAYPGAALLVDDAHGVGVLGEHGRGMLEHAGLYDAQVNAHDDSDSGTGGCEDGRGTGPRVYLCASLSKALGGYGGIIPGTHRFIEWLRLRSPVYSGATPLPPAVAAATAEGIRIAADEPALRRRLLTNARALKSGLLGMGLTVDAGPAPVAAVCLESAQLMQQMQQDMAGSGILIAYLVRYPGVPAQGALRIAVFATHTETMIDRLLNEFRVHLDRLRESPASVPIAGFGQKTSP